MQLDLACENCSGFFGSDGVGAGCCVLGLARMFGENKWTEFNKLYLQGHLKNDSPKWCPIKSRKLYEVEA